MFLGNGDRIGYCNHDSGEVLIWNTKENRAISLGQVAHPAQLGESTLLSISPDEGRFVLAIAQFSPSTGVTR